MKTVKKIAVVLALIILQSILFCSEAWRKDWKNALEECSIRRKPLLIDFYTDWCPPCKKLSKITFRDKKVINYLQKENFILVKINPEKDREAEKRFKVFSYPTLLLFNKKGFESARILGYRSPKEFVKTVSDLRKGIGTLKDLLEKYKSDGKNLDLISKIIDKYIARADYPPGLRLLEKTIKMDPGNLQGKASEAMFRKGYIFFKWKKYRRSIDILKSIKKIYPGSKEAEDGYGAAIEYSLKLKDKGLTSSLVKTFLKEFPKSRYAEEYKKLIDINK